jgi:hypothetical protein
LNLCAFASLRELFLRSAKVSRKGAKAQRRHKAFFAACSCEAIPPM